MVYKLNKKKQNTNAKKKEKLSFFLFFLLFVSIIQEQESIKDRKKNECIIQPPAIYGSASIRNKRKKKGHGVLATK